MSFDSGWKHQISTEEAPKYEIKEKNQRLVRLSACPEWQPQVSIWPTCGCSLVLFLQITTTKLTACNLAQVIFWPRLI